MREFKSFYKVYVHTLFDGRKYIGVTKQTVERRWRNGEGYKSENGYFYRAIKKYGWDAFKHEIIAENLSEEEALQMECDLIKKYQTQNRSFGFNMSGGGEGNYNPSPETRKKIGEVSRRVNTGRKHTEEYKKKMSEYMRRNNPNANGKCLTKEKIESFRNYAKQPKTEIQKMRLSQSAKKHKVECVETGEVFESMKSAADNKGINYTSLTCAVYDPHRRAGGYHWRTYNETSTLDESEAYEYWRDNVNPNKDDCCNLRVADAALF